MKKLCSILIALSMLCTLFTGGAMAEETHEAITMLAYWSWDTAAFEAAFHEAYPEVNLNVVTIATNNMSEYFKLSLANGDIPDIYVSTVLPEEELAARYLIDLSEEEFINAYRESALDEVAMDGAIYVLPGPASISGLVYNKTLVEQYDITLPQSFEDMVALKDVVAQIDTNPDLQKFYDANEAKYAPYNITVDDKVQVMAARMHLDGHIWNLFWNLGATDFFGTPDGEQWKKDFLNGEATAVGNLESVMQVFQDYIDAGFIEAEYIGNNWANPTFMIGGALIHSCSSWTVAHWESADYGTWDYGIMPFLAEDGGDNMLCTYTSRYYGLSKMLEGNEQKLADAKKVLAFLSTPEGQQAWATTGYGTEKEQVNDTYYSPITATSIPEGSFLKEVEDLLDEGYVQPLVSCYGPWEDIVTSFADVLYEVVRGNMTGEEALAELDRINQERLTTGGVYIAESPETLDQETTARLVDIAIGEATGADAAMVSVCSLTDCHTANAAGIMAPLYAGHISESTVTMITPNYSSAVQTVTMTGKELKEAVAAGLDVNGETFPYVLVMKGGAEPAEDAAYTVAFISGNVPEAMKEQAVTTEVKGNAAVSAYVQQLGTVSADKLDW